MVSWGIQRYIWGKLGSVDEGKNDNSRSEFMYIKKKKRTDYLQVQIEG